MQHHPGLNFKSMSYCASGLDYAYVPINFNFKPTQTAAKMFSFTGHLPLATAVTAAFFVSLLINSWSRTYIYWLLILGSGQEVGPLSLEVPLVSEKANPLTKKNGRAHSVRGSACDISKELWVDKGWGGADDAVWVDSFLLNEVTRQSNIWCLFS